MSKAITERKDAARGGPGFGGTGPSIRVEREPTAARIAALVGAALSVIGGVILWLTVIGERTNLAFGPGVGSLILFVGVCCLLVHAAVDRDVQFRLMYLAVAGACFVAGVVMCLLPFHSHVGGLFAGGFFALVAALLFVLAALRHDTDEGRRGIAQLIILGAGSLMVLIGLIGSFICAGYRPANEMTAFLLPYGALLAGLGLAYMLAFIGSRGASDDLSVLVGWVILAVGGLTFALALGYSVVPPLFHYFKWWHVTPADYFFPFGLILMVIGAAFAGAAYLTCSDAPLAVLTRRELAAYFFSPMAYLLFFGFSVIAWAAFGYFFSTLWFLSQHKQPVLEPVVQYYLFSLLPAFAMVFVVPVLTMRLVSEEKRSGTLEVLLTAPVEEPTVVLSKFIAGWLMFLATWVPFFLLLIPLAAAGAPFDYRPLMSFVLSLVVAGAGMVGMGLFFSSLTRNQLVAAVLTFAGMLVLTSVYLIQEFFREGGGAWLAVLKHMSYLESWQDTLQGKVTPNIGLVFYASMAVFFLFLSVKVLESRKWW
jgi:ABC-type transport system involved in multi-copper enzyme maturation permease subunit